MNIEAIKKLLSEQRDSLHVFGSKTSKNDCFKSLGLELALKKETAIERLDDTSVRVSADTLVSDLLDRLDSWGLALPTIGEWSGQTLAGAVSTGTHGGSLFHGSLMSSVIGVSFLDGRGQLLKAREGESDLTFLLPSFGSTGVFVDFDLRCEPAFSLAMTRSLYEADQYIKNITEMVSSAEFSASVWLPNLNALVEYSAERIQMSGNVEKTRELRFNNKTMIADWLATFLRKKSEPAIKGNRELLRRFRASLCSNLFPDAYYIGNYRDVLAPIQSNAKHILKKRKKNRTPPEGEFAVQFDRLESFLGELKKIFTKTSSYPDRPIGLRPGKQERGALAATHTGDGIWVSLFVRRSSKLMIFLPGLLREFEAKPHWGKTIFNDLSSLPSMYDEWADFVAFRNHMDPDKRFINAFCQRLGIN